MNTISIKRAYAAPADGDGRRILVDRLWPRGISKAKAAIDVWLKDVAPSAELRKWFHHDAALFDEFRQRYVDELKQSDAARQLATDVKEWLTEGPVTLLYGAKDEEHNNAVVLREWLLSNINNEQR